MIRTTTTTSKIITPKTHHASVSFPEAKLTTALNHNITYYIQVEIVWVIQKQICNCTLLSTYGLTIFFPFYFFINNKDAVKAVKLLSPENPLGSYVAYVACYQIWPKRWNPLLFFILMLPQRLSPQAPGLHHM